MSGFRYLRILLSGNGYLWVLETYMATLSIVGICILKLLSCIKRKIIAPFDIAECIIAWQMECGDPNWPGGALVSSALCFDLFTFFFLGTVPNLPASPRRWNVVQPTNTSDQPQNGMEQTWKGGHC